MDNISKLFTNSNNIEKLAGGEDKSYRVGDLSIKPVIENEKYEWVAKSFEDLSSSEILISKPVKSLNGNYIENGYCATNFIPGSFYENRMIQKLEAADKFHKLTKNIVKPGDFSKWSSPWSFSTQVAWQEIELPGNFNKKAKDILYKLINHLEDLALDFQFIHTDPAGNILFNNNGIPIIIDITPDFRPVEYANALLVVDSIAWHNEPIISLDLLKYDSKVKKQLILRAVIFRLCVPLFFYEENYSLFSEELENFKEVINYLNINIYS